MRTINIILVILLASFSCETSTNVAPRFENYFVKYYGEEGDQTGVDVKQLADGFIVLGNSTAEPGNSQIFLTKVDHLGNEVWPGPAYFGGPGNDVAVAIEIDANGNFIIAATVQINGADRDVMILKVSADGIKIDSAVFGASGKDDVANNILITREGDYILTGYTTNVDISKPGYNVETDLEDIYSIRTRANLEALSAADWRQVYGFPGRDRGIEVRQKDDGTFLFFGTTNKPPTTNSQQAGLNMFLFPAATDGIAISSTPLQLFGTLSDESASQIIQTASGGFAMLGTSQTSGVNKAYLARVRSNNAFISSGLVSTNRNIKATSIAAASGGGYVMLGENIENNSSNIYIARLALDGSVVWDHTFGSVDNNMPGTILETEDGSIVLVGTIDLESQTKICLIKVTDKGELKP